MNKIRIVLDSNVILSAALFKSSSPRQAFDKAMTTGQIMMSTATLVELQDIFNRPKFDRYLSKSSRTDFLNDLIAVVETVEIIQSFSVCRDRKIDRGCNWLHHYLKNNVSVNEADRRICDGVF